MDHSMKPPPAAGAAASSSRRWVLATSMCSLACLFLLSAGYRPLQPRTAAAWDRFSRVQQKAAPSPPPPLAPRGSSPHAAPAPDAISPSAGGGPADYWSPEDEEDAGPPAPAPAPAPSEEAGEDDGDAQCDLFDGEWVEEPAGYGYPLYDAAECPFLSDQVACRRNGRPDSGYERWRWQPRGCSGRTRLGGAEALELCRNKRVVLVGDSLNRNMWESLACILYAAVPDRSRTRIVDDAGSEYRIFRAMDYNCSVEFFWSPFLVKLETKDDRTKALMLDQLPPMMQRALCADVLIFNTGHWWTHTGKLRAWDHLEWDGKMVQMAGEEAFDGALRTWARWVDYNIDPSRTRVFFRSVSPEHKRCIFRTTVEKTLPTTLSLTPFLLSCSINWCYNQTAPISKGNIAPWFPKSLINIIEKNIKKMKTPIIYMNITRLSELRIDAHPSIYTITREGKPLSKEQMQQPLTYSDCSHWCLPGLPDTWNVLLFNFLIRPLPSI
ncbi:unnamed protein product [Miscanthus lutarioriparius]|uniref:Trichome birefringence-like N-terminal domain-containing protein n=1 Tax=Miscanthus lutarioriparius TaxID=422564 RepID=A0A811P043_9POAL|nr:unnamed protein product [Miscanthus lutarioriparius]